MVERRHTSAWCVPGTSEECSGPRGRARKSRQWRECMTGRGCCGGLRAATAVPACVCEGNSNHKMGAPSWSTHAAMRLACNALLPVHCRPMMIDTPRCWVLCGQQPIPSVYTLFLTFMHACVAPAA